MDNQTRRQVQAKDQAYWTNYEKEWRNAGLEGFNYNSCRSVRRGKRSTLGSFSEDQNSALFAFASLKEAIQHYED